MCDTAYYICSNCRYTTQRQPLPMRIRLHVCGRPSWTGSLYSLLNVLNVTRVADGSQGWKLDSRDSQDLRIYKHWAFACFLLESVRDPEFDIPRGILLWSRFFSLARFLYFHILQQSSFHLYHPARAMNYVYVCLIIFPPQPKSRRVFPGTEQIGG